MGKSESNSEEEEEEEEDSDDKPKYQISSLDKPKKLKTKFDFKKPVVNNNAQWGTVTGTVLKKGNHKVKVKFDLIKWEDNMYTGLKI
jgi:hypothetical protein